MTRKILTTCIAVCSLAACKHQQKETATAAFSLTDTMMARIALVTAEEKQVTGELRLFGKVTAANDKQAQVYPAVGGNVTKVNVELGDYVQQGQILAVIRSSEAAEYERQRMDATNDVAIAEKNLQVARDLFEGKLTAERDVLAAEKELQKARADLKRINEVFAIYRLGDGASYYVTAPMSGFIIDKNVTANMQLRSDRSENLFSIAQINEVWVVANVNESDISKIKEGMDAGISTISYPDRLFTGKVDKIFNILDDNTRSMKVRISIPNTDLALKPEMSATVTLKVKENRRMVSVPSSAIIFDKSRNWVMVFKDRQHIETRMVELYSQCGDTTYLSSGLESGEKVIAKDQLLIYDALND